MSTLRQTTYNILSRLQLIYFRAMGMDIGQGVKLSRRARLDRTHPTGVHIGSYTAIAPGVSVLTHDFVKGRHVDTWIGSNSFIGTGAVIMPGVRVGDHCVVGAGSVVMSDVPDHSIVIGVPARLTRSGIVTGRWGIMADNFLELETSLGRPPKRPPAVGSSAGVTDFSLSSEALIGILQSENPELDESALRLPVDQLGIDSFGLINVRVEIEAASGRPVPDSLWAGLRTFDQLLKDRKAVPEAASENQSLTKQYSDDAVAGGEDLRESRSMARALEAREYTINMPQMALRGLSESWLAKEIGDLHWGVLMRELRANSSSLADPTGARLYATFTRLRYRSDVPLTDYRENERLRIELTAERYGASIFFGSGHAQGSRGAFRFDVMSTFSRYGEAGANTSLLKGQPEIPASCCIPELSELPDFGKEYRSLRAADLPTPIAELPYEIIPPHDINGVGLLYFAAYPSIAETCLTRLKGAWLAFGTSLVFRDICYFANADPEDTIIFRLHDWHEDEKLISYTTTLSRASDGKVMARISGEKVRVQLPPPGLPSRADA